VFGRLVTTIATCWVALVVAIAVPVSQLRMISFESSCCCPDPDRCRCPDHDPTDDPAAPAIRACHNTQQAITTSPLPAFEPPVVAVVAIDERTIEPASFPSSAPHAPPTPQRPDAPS